MIVMIILFAIYIPFAVYFFIRVLPELRVTEEDICDLYYSGKFHSYAEYGKLQEEKYRNREIPNVIISAIWLVGIVITGIILEREGELEEDSAWFWITAAWWVLIAVGVGYHMFTKSCRNAHKEIFKLAAKVNNIPDGKSSEWNSDTGFHITTGPIYAIKHWDKFKSEHRNEISKIIWKEYTAFAETWLLPQDWIVLRSEEITRQQNQLMFLIENCQEVRFSVYCLLITYLGQRDIRNKEIVQAKQGKPTRISYDDAGNEIFIYEVNVGSRSWPLPPDSPEGISLEPSWIIRHLFYFDQSGKCKKLRIEREADGYIESLYRE